MACMNVSFHFHDLHCFLTSKTYKIHVLVNVSVTIKDLGGISFPVMAETWKHVKDILAFLFFGSYNQNSLANK